MKKYIITILIALCIAIIPNVKAANIELPEKTDHEKVTIYLFWSSTCQHCHDFITYFSDKYLDYSDYFEIVTYQVNKSSVNSSLMSAVGAKIDETGGYIPLIVIGESYHVVGFGSDGSEIIEEALKAYQDENYKDLVAETIAEEKSNAEAKTFLEACQAAGVTCAGDSSSSKVSDGIVIGIIFGVIVIGFAGLVFYSRK